MSHLRSYVNVYRKLGYSKTVFYNKIKALTELNPSQFVRTVELEEAGRLLKNTNMNVSEVAFKLVMQISIISAASLKSSLIKRLVSLWKSKIRQQALSTLKKYLLAVLLNLLTLHFLPKCKVAITTIY